MRKSSAAIGACHEICRKKRTLTLRYPHFFHSEINRLLAIGLERSARMTQSWR